MSQNSGIKAALKKVKINISPAPMQISRFQQLLKKYFAWLNAMKLIKISGKGDCVNTLNNYQIVLFEIT